MQIILLEKVANLGDLGDVVKVKDGFARNYLIPHGKAKRATPENHQPSSSAPRRAGKGAGRRVRRGAGAATSSTDSRRCRSPQKAGVDGRLFGSVTNVDIAEALQRRASRSRGRDPDAAGSAEADRRPPIDVALHTDVVAHITVSVLGEQSARRSRQSASTARGGSRV